ncbi:MAG: HIT domain-containing protein [Calothrix sp. SM1_5_4]|nr:HIT domain-containing protein [Calothrix sp. SM1_5_4]
MSQKKPKRSRSRKSVKSTRKTDWAVRLVKDVWPQERDFFERPDRYRYVRKLLPEAGECVFCQAARAELSPESLVLAKDDLVMVVMNKYPYNTGHLLVVPLEHKGEIWEFGDEVGARVALWLKRGARILKDVLSCHGFNMGLNHGAVAGAGIPDHLHWHIVPRWGGDTNFFPLIAETKALPETLAQTYGRLRARFKEFDK